MSAIELAFELGHQELIFVREPSAGLRAVIAIHDDSLGPAAGGTRVSLYPSLEAAAIEALRLSRAMTYKAAMAELGYGGAKAVILADPARDKTPALLRAYAEAVERLDGRFITGCDMGLQSADVAVMTRVTRYVSHTMAGSEVDTADLAALGVFESIRATAGFLGRELNGLRVAVQGLGQVGARLARQLAHAGARLWIADLDSARVSALAAELEAIPVAPAAVYDLPVELFSPNAGGSVLNDATIPRLRCRAVVGGANDQLAEPRHGDLLDQRGIAYAPDYLVNAGGLMSLLYETGALDLEGVRARVRGIGPRLLALLERARAEALAPHRLADRMVEQRLAAARAAAREPSR